MGYLRLEDLKVLRRSPDLFNNVKLGQGFTARNKTYFVIPYIGVAAILVKWPKTILWILHQTAQCFLRNQCLDRYVAVELSGTGKKVTDQLDIFDILYLYKTIVS